MIRQLYFGGRILSLCHPGCAPYISCHTMSRALSPIKPILPIKPMSAVSALSASLEVTV